MIGSTLGSYVVEGLLGSGGSGHVYAARDSKLGQRVAIKLLRPELSDDPALCERFRLEAENLALLDHPNITELYALHGESIGDRQNLFMVMELIEGLTLDQVVGPGRGLGTRASLAIMAQALDGLAYAHARGMIHRDIKPSNLMLSDSGLLKIMDFGISRVEGSQRLTRQGMIVGTLAYIAPEQIKGAAGDGRTDLYSLACVLYELLSGIQPFRGDNEYELIRAQIELDPEPLSALVPDLAPPIAAAIMQALAKEPEDRFASLEDFADRLGTAALKQDAAAIVRDEVLPTVRQNADAQSDETALRSRRVLRPSVTAGATSLAAAPRGSAGTPLRRQRRSRPALAGMGAALALAACAGGFYLAHEAQQAAAGSPAPAATEQALAAPPAPAPQPAADPVPPLVIAGEVSAYAAEGWPMIDGRVLRLSGVDTLVPEAVKAVADWVGAHGNYLECNPVGPDRYRCLTRQNLDLTQAILLNGGARTSADADPAYRAAEAQARAGKRGLWR